MIPQIILIILILIELLIVANMHGKPRDNYNFFVTLTATIITVTILGFGGFWSIL